MKCIPLELILAYTYSHTPLFLAHLAKGHVSFCHHLASVVRRKLFQKSSALKLLDQLKSNLL
jgi:hypothetical protein